ncbi:YceI family protein [Winogradskyella jejuensis]|uniref:Polyisoprenoid-binding protein YceI n=1 Tax=Winogradskyella jejuensis TaxID=1089305 RepID=A0A1M5M9P3_9FLAO|nr:YceI family protein [Winogradskyella jejuensis]SHG73961.1 Polyisoprenoid-binding protein YceI [Winogradskyella jejuensis]
MKTRIFSIVFTVFTTLFFSQTSSLDTEEKLNIDVSKSQIKWSGEYAFYYGGHDGIINFKEGYFIKRNGAITGGEFIIDMNSIQSQDMDNEEARTDLDKHLKNEDFFDVEKYPIAKLIITSVSYHDAIHLKIYADLTIKDVTLPVNFEARAIYEKEQLKTRFKIDRTLWNINYKSKGVAGKLKDGLISDAIGFEVKLSL